MFKLNLLVQERNLRTKCANSSAAPLVTYRSWAGMAMYQLSRRLLRPALEMQQILLTAETPFDLLVDSFNWWTRLAGYHNLKINKVILV